MWNAILDFLRVKFVHILTFFVVNIVVGSLGIWVPLFGTLMRPDMQFNVELHKALMGGGWYTFSAAYLTGSCSALAYEFIDRELAVFKKLKVMLGVISSFLIIICFAGVAFLTPPVYQALSSEASKIVPYNIASLPVTSSNLTKLNDKEISEAASSNSTELNQKEISKDKIFFNTSEWTQLGITFFSAFIGLVIFIVVMLGDPDLKNQYEIINHRVENESGDLAKLAATITDDQL